MLKRFQAVVGAPGETRTLRVPVDLKVKMDPLYEQGKWPHRLRVTATVRQASRGAALARSQVELPIRPADS